MSGLDIARYCSDQMGQRQKSSQLRCKIKSQFPSWKGTLVVR
jgi:hypothetical protein